MLGGAERDAWRAEDDDTLMNGVKRDVLREQREDTSMVQKNKEKGEKSPNPRDYSTFGLKRTMMKIE